MACRLFRELKLGLLKDPMPELAVSKIVFKDIINLPRQESEDEFELRALNDSGMDINSESKLVSRDIENSASKDIVLED
jgi:hypothetical protein